MNKINENIDYGKALAQQIMNINKALAYDIISKQAQELTEENKTLKARVKYLEDLIAEYTGKMAENLKL